MTEISYTTMQEEKAQWGPGPWDDEPDKLQWTDEATGLPCLVKRNHLGALCGYVGVPEGHPAFEMGYDAVHDLFPNWDEEGALEVHGGITYAAHCQEGPEEHTICHIPDPGQPDHVFWLGFDTAHSGDLVPAMTAYAYEQQFGPDNELVKLTKKHENERPKSWPQDTYKNIDYVRAETRNLARQLATLQ